MSETLLRYIIVQIFLFLLLFVFFRLFYKANRTLELEKRLLRFSPNVTLDVETSFFDKLKYSYYTFVTWISKRLIKSKLLENYSEHYEKYVTNSKIIRDSSINIISNKFVFAFFGFIISIIFDVINLNSLNFSKAILISFFAFVFPDIVMMIGRRREQIKMEQDFLKAVIIMNNAFKSGRSIIQAIEVVANELDGVVSEEFYKMYTDLTYGLDLEVVFERFSKRIDLEESKYMASSLVIINKTGGDVVKVFSSIEKSFLARKRLNDELKSATALSNFVFRILIFIPFIIFATMYVINPLYFKPFIETFIGKIILLLIVIIYIVYILIIKKVMKVKE